MLCLPEGRPWLSIPSVGDDLVTFMDGGRIPSQMQAGKVSTSLIVMGHASARRNVCGPFSSLVNS